MLAVKDLPVETNLLWEREYYFVAPYDFNRDSTDELVVMQSDMSIQPMDQKLYSMIATRTFDRNTFEAGGSICGGVTGQDTDIMWTTYKRNDSLFLYDLWPRREMFVVTGKDNAKPKGWDGNIIQIILCDINNDSNLEAVAMVNTGWDLRPRGIYVLDWSTGKLLWKYDYGPCGNKFLLRDVDGDRNIEILVSTVANGNDNTANGTSDLKSYVFMFDCDGTLRWSTAIGRYSSTAMADWLDRKIDNELKIAVIEKGNTAGGRELDSIFLLDPLTGEIESGVQYGIFTAAYSIYYTKNKEGRIVIGGSDDTLRVLDERLNLVGRYFVNGDGIWNIEVGDLTGDNQTEIAVYTNRGNLLLYNTKFEILAKYPTRYILSISQLNYHGNKRLLLHLDRDNGIVWQLLEFKKASLLKKSVPLGPILAGVILLVIAGWIIILYARYRRIHDMRMVVRGLVGRAGVIELNRDNRVRHINQRAKEILGIKDKTKITTLETLESIKQFDQLGNIFKMASTDSDDNEPKETIVYLQPGQIYLIRCLQVKRGRVLTFEDISAVEYMKRIAAWTPVAQKLAHGLKNPLSTILGSVEQIDIVTDQADVKKYTGYVKDEVIRLRKMADAFMQFTKFSIASSEPKNINETIKNLIVKYKSTTPEVIKIDYQLSARLPLFSFDEGGMSTAINIILENAVDAVKNHGVVKISTSLVDRKYDVTVTNDKNAPFIKIEIEDNGIGIPQKYLDKIFDPYFTYNKPHGTGLGLPLAKKIIEDHKGIIEVQSQEKVGTKVTIYLPV